MPRLHRGSVLAGLVLLSVALAPSLQAQTSSPVGAQFQVNSYTSGNQLTPVVASNTAGNFLVVWRSERSPSEFNDNSVQARLYDKTGNPLSAQVQLNTYTTGQQFAPAVASDTLGRFVVVWNSSATSLGDGSGYSIIGRIVGADGTPVGSEFLVNTYRTGDQRYPVVAPLTSGGFVVAWQSVGSPGTDNGVGSYESVQAQRFDSSAFLVGAQFQVNTYTTGHQRRVAAASDAAGNFVVVWQSSADAVDTAGYSVHARRYNASGASLVGPFLVNTHTTGFLAYPSIGMSTAGAFVVAWTALDSSSADDTLKVSAQRFDSAASKLGSQFQVNSYTTSEQQHQVVAMAPAGTDFVVAWESSGSATDADGESEQARRIYANGATIGGQFEVHTWTTGAQKFPGVAMDSQGNFVVVWSSARGSETDFDSNSIQGRWYDAILRDCFESNGFTRWSAKVPP
jgi:hypothetical protein